MFEMYPLPEKVMDVNSQLKGATIVFLMKLELLDPNPKKLLAPMLVLVLNKKQAGKGAVAHVAIPAAFDVNILLAPSVPSVILMVPLTSSLAAGVVVPIPTFCAVAQKAKHVALRNNIYLIIIVVCVNVAMFL